MALRRASSGSASAAPGAPPASLSRPATQVPPATGAAQGSKRRPADPQGPVLELLRSFGVRDRGGFYDSRIRGKFVRFDNMKTPAAARPEVYRGPRRPDCDARPGGRYKEGKEQWGGLKFEDFEPLRKLWASYIADLQLGHGEELARGLAMADLHGSTIKVVSAQNPGCVRLRGTVLEETQRTFRIITSENKVKVLPKERCVFEVEVATERVRLFGPAWAHRLPGAAPGPLTPLRWSVSG